MNGTFDHSTNCAKYECTFDHSTNCAKYECTCGMGKPHNLDFE